MKKYAMKAPFAGRQVGQRGHGSITPPFTDRPGESFRTYPEKSLFDRVADQVVTDADYPEPPTDSLVEASQLFTRYQKCRLAGNHDKALRFELLLYRLKMEAPEHEKEAIAVFTDAIKAEQADRAERLGLRSYIA